MNLDLTSFMEMNSKWIMGSNVKCKTVKLLEDNMEKNLDDLRFGMNF